MAGEQITSNGQIEWHGLLMGPGTDYDVITIAGWYGAPGSRRVTIDRPGRHGGLPGELRAAERVIEAEIAFGGLGEGFRTAREAIAAALAWDENPVEEPLVIQMDGVPTLVNARVINAAMPTPTSVYNQGEGFASVQWVATDPRRYGVALRSTSTGLPEPVNSGLPFPLGFPLDFGEGAAGGSMTMYNDGNVPAWPIWEIVGPITGPIITCQATGDRLEFNSTFEVADGQTLRIDTDTGQVTLGTTSRADQLDVAQWFPIPPGSKEVRFTASGGTGMLIGYVRDAYLA